MKLLIVDDSQYIRMNLLKLLKPVEDLSRIFEAENPTESYKIIEEEKPDIIILDIKMSGGSGFDVLRFAKKQKPIPTVVMLTNYNYEYYKNKSFEENADYFFDKSTEFMGILKVIDRIKSLNIE